MTGVFLAALGRRMRVRLEKCELVTVPPGEEHFECVRESISPVRGAPQAGHEALLHALVECHPHEVKAGHICARCSHLLNAVPAPDGKSVRVRCVFFESDPVTTLMTRAEDIVTVDEHEKVAVAAARMLKHTVDQLVVTSDEEVVSLVSARDLDAAPTKERVANHARAPLPVVPRTMPLGGVVRAMRAQPHEVLLVLDGSELAGLITRGDLRRAGIAGL